MSRTFRTVIRTALETFSSMVACVQIYCLSDRFFFLPCDVIFLQNHVISDLFTRVNHPVSYTVRNPHLDKNTLDKCVTVSYFNIASNNLPTFSTAIKRTTHARGGRATMKTTTTTASTPRFQPEACARPPRQPTMTLSISPPPPLTTNRRRGRSSPTTRHWARTTASAHRTIGRPPDVPNTISRITITAITINRRSTNSSTICTSTTGKCSARPRDRRNRYRPLRPRRADPRRVLRPSCRSTRWSRPKRPRTPPRVISAPLNCTSSNTITRTVADTVAASVA